MTEMEFIAYKYFIINNCPRGEEYFCDGTPNPSVDDGVKRDKIEPCAHRINGKCTYLENLLKVQVCDNGCEKAAAAGF